MLGLDAHGRTVVAEVHLQSDLAQKGPTRLDPIAIENASLARIVYFEQSPGALSRAAVVRSPAGTVAIDDRNDVRAAQLPHRGNVALLPGKSRWYVLWPEGTALKSASF